jgi:hypothetical protein
MESSSAITAMTTSSSMSVNPGRPVLATASDIPRCGQDVLFFTTPRILTARPALCKHKNSNRPADAAIPRLAPTPVVGGIPFA